jgi:radical SAM protein (TIGR01212 family)
MKEINRFKYTLDNKRYHTFNYFLKNKFGKKVFKVALDAGFTCPNKKTGGCIYCSDGSKSNIVNNKKSIQEQFEEVKNIMLNKWPDSLYIPYFQANTNTYDSLDKLKELYEPILNNENVVGIAIATRPDCITDEILDYLDELNKKTFLMIELGLQSSYDKTLEYINRGHTVKEFDDMVKKLKERNIFVVVHIINGLPHETKDMMIETVKHLNKLNIDAIKIHMLHVDKNTKLADIYEKEKFHLLTKEEYIDIVTEQLTYLKPEIVIERITGDPILEDLIEPKWLLKKFVLLNDIDKEMIKKNYYQGINCK